MYLYFQAGLTPVLTARQTLTNVPVALASTWDTVRTWRIATDASAYKGLMVGIQQNDFNPPPPPCITEVKCGNMIILTLSLARATKVAHYDVTLYWHGRLKSPK